ncbi:hypothetical protein ACWDYH_33780 [Nocardia goodfellowii]
MSPQSTTTLLRPAPGKNEADGSFCAIEQLFADFAQLRHDDPRRIVVREELLASCLPLAERIARRFDGRGAAFEQLLRAARSGMTRAIDRHDGSKPFLHSAIPVVTDAVRSHFRAPGSVTRMPQRLADIRHSIGPAAIALDRRLGRMPTAAQIAAELDADLLAVVHALVIGNATR